jgi:hypothetical protein
MEEIRAEVRIPFDIYRRYAIYNAYYIGNALKRFAIVELVLAPILLLMLLSQISTGFDLSTTAIVLFSYALLAGSNLRVLSRIKSTYAGIQEKDAVSSYRFQSEAISIETVGKNASGHSEFRYGGFLRVIERKDAFYFYTGENQALLVPKGTIVEGKSSGLSAMLKAKMGQKYFYFN